MNVFVFAAIATEERWPAILTGIRLELPSASILRVKNAEQAAHQLFDVSFVAGEPQVPDVILIELGDSKVAETELLFRINADSSTRHTPVIRLVSKGNADPTASDKEQCAQTVPYEHLGDTDLQLAVRDSIRAIGLCTL
jgi:hypothetical protein